MEAASKALVNRRAGRPAREHEAGTSSPSGRCRAVSTPHGDRNPCRKRKPGAGRRLTAGILVPEAKARFYKNRFARPQGALRNERDFSDGALRLISLLRPLMEKGRGNGTALLRTAGLPSPFSAVIQFSDILGRVRGNDGSQVTVSVRSTETLCDQGLEKNEVVLLAPGENVAEIQEAANIHDVQRFPASDSSATDIFLPKTRPAEVRELPKNRRMDVPLSAPNRNAGNRLSLSEDVAGWPARKATQRILQARRR